jgi:DNA-binding MarR family transcriptional regulator
MEDKLSIEEYYELCFSIHQTCEAIKEACWYKAREHGISPTGAMVLCAIQKLGGEAGPAEISRIISRKPNSVSELTNRMEKSGLVAEARQLSSQVKGIRRITVTKEGKEILRSLFVKELIPQLLSSLTVKDLKTIRSVLGKLRTSA